MVLLLCGPLTFALISLKFPTDRIVGIRIKAVPNINDVILFSVYLPCRTGCTDFFREVLDC